MNAAANPFRTSVPKGRFLGMIQAPGAAILALALLLAGLFSNHPYFHDVKVKSLGEGLESPGQIEFVSPVTAAIDLVAGTLGHVVHFPEVCLPGRAVNEFQTKQCATFEERLERRAVLAAVPLILYVLFVWYALGWIEGVYRRGARALDEKKAKFGGVITDPAEAPGDLFSRLTGLRPIGVQVKAGAQIAIYLHADDPIPMPGQTFAIFELGQALGAMRYTGILYAPHLAVISASR